MTEACTAGSAAEKLSREASVLEAKPLDTSLSMSLHRSSLPIPGAPIHGTSGGGSRESTVQQRRVLNGSRILEPGVIQRCVLDAARGSKEYVSAYTAGRGAE
ncbi:MAG TPA: hypothetical protein VMT52_06970 [Planctomycetota bacterium]|nr:hypothetical protein [Planctomycetota bacterium]